MSLRTELTAGGVRGPTDLIDESLSDERKLENTRRKAATRCRRSCLIDTRTCRTAGSSPTPPRELRLWADRNSGRGAPWSAVLLAAALGEPTETDDVDVDRAAILAFARASALDRQAKPGDGRGTAGVTCPRGETARIQRPDPKGERLARFSRKAGEPCSLRGRCSPGGQRTIRITYQEELGGLWGSPQKLSER